MDLRDGPRPGSPRPRWSSSGADDLALPPEHQRVIADGIPGAELLTVEPRAPTWPTWSGRSRSPGALLAHLDAGGIR